MRISACHDASVYGLGSAAAPVVRDLASPVEVRMKAGYEQQIVVLGPVRILPGIIDDVDINIRRQQGGKQGTYLRLKHAPVMPTLSVKIHVGKDDPDFHLAPPSSKLFGLIKRIEKASLMSLNRPNVSDRSGKIPRRICYAEDADASNIGPIPCSVRFQCANDRIFRLPLRR